VRAASDAHLLNMTSLPHINVRYDESVSDDRCDLLCLDQPRAEELRLARPSRSAVRRAAAVAAALGDPTRLELAAALNQGGELCVCDLGWITARSQNLVSHHLRALRRAELVTSRRDGKMVMYELTAVGQALLQSVLAPSAEVIA
jgi:ArsR family transcriptional regulator, lead/cadmium/zinc/bismuth-responsive transcriptional repressor